MSLFLKISKSKSKRQKEERFLQNGGILLKELIASSKGKYNPIRGFTDKEIEIATSNYDQQKLIKEYLFYSLYKGFLQDRPVSVMKFNSQDGEYGLNSIVFAAQMRHKNILNLIGCCLESLAPILVFEYVGYGTLADRLYGSYQPHFEPLLLTHRLKVAMEIANAIAYLHCGFPRPIVSRDIAASYIVFHEQYVAKLFDFSLSISIPEGETHIEDYVAGTIGYVAPDFLESNKINEKLDVYSFGVLLLELLTGQKAIDSSRDDKSLVIHVKNCNELNKFTEIVDPVIIGTELSQEKELQLQAFKELALKCVSDSEEDRPTMIDVAKQLRQIYKSIVN